MCLCVCVCILAAIYPSCKQPLPTTQETTLHMDITRWSTLKTNDGEAVCSQQKTRPGADSDHEILTANFRFKLKKVGKTARPFMYELNQIPYNYTVKVTNRFKGLDLMECLKNYGQGS